MFRVSGRQILALQGGGGELFTAFVDALLRAHGAVLGLTDADVDTTIRANVADGGVDTLVRRSAAADPTGWLSAAPTSWQYKGTDYGNVRIAGLLNGVTVRQRIEAGDAYRLAIADNLPEPTRLDWERRLTEEARRIRGDAPEARVVTADELAAWVTRYPGLVLSYFHPALAQTALHLEAWGRNVLNATPRFVPVAAWAPARENVTRHVVLTNAVNAVVQPLWGEAGVGKTRLAYEVVSALPGAAALVVYCGDEDAAVRVATELANDGDTQAILIADECGPEGRSRLARALGGHRHRVRVVAIDNSNQRLAGVQGELLLGKMPPEALRAVLDNNFPNVAPDRRRAYASLAEGFPRLAADLCVHDGVIARAGHLGPVVPTISEYLQVRLTPPQLEALAALSLLTKVGYHGDVATELDSLCAMLELTRANVERSLHEIHDGPGFVGRTSHYFYVTPELIARVAYSEAWRRWGRDPEAFFESVPEQMLQQVLDRAWRSAPEEVRRACAAHFQRWADGLTPGQLIDNAVVRRLVALADTHPPDFVPRVLNLVERASGEELTSVHGQGLADGRWGPRRTLVWFAERFAQFPDYFDDAERLLLRLAINESEPGIANNASAIWCQLYRIVLSGTSVPFPERLARLRDRLLATSEGVRTLAITALNGVFEFHAVRMLGPAVVAGRLPPEEWRPRSTGELLAAFNSAMDLLAELVTQTDELRSAVVRIVTAHMRSLVTQGLFRRVRELLGSVSLSDKELAALVEQLDATLAYDLEPSKMGIKRPRGRVQTTIDEVAKWREDLSSRDLHTQLVTTVGKDQWAPSRVHAAVQAREGGVGSADPFMTTLEAIARELIRDPAFLQRELSWLTSDEARSAGDLGEVLGRQDAEGGLAPILVSRVTLNPTPSLIRGYLHGLLAGHPDQEGRVNRLLDEAERIAPAAAAELAISAGDLAKPMQRALRLFDAGKLPVAYLADRNFAASGGGELQPRDMKPLLERLAKAAESGDQAAEQVGIDSIALRLPYDTPVDPAPLLVEDPELRQLGWRLLRARPPGSRPGSRWWRQLVVALGRIDPKPTAELAASLIKSDDFGSREEGEAALRALAASHPTDVMEALGNAILDEKTGWRFFLGSYGDLVQALPVAILRAWLERVGVEGARRIARHLPTPTINTQGDAVVPELTEWVLTRFEEDDRTFQEFCAGTHNLQLYSGDIAAEHEAEAATARRFLNHPLRRIREWAAFEERTALADASEARRLSEESDLP